jgi:hypothetical protein
MTRRELIQGAIYCAGIAVIPSAHAAKGEFWNDKQPGPWTSAKIDRLLARSPWAKDAEVEFNMSGGDGPGDSPGGFGGGIGRGGPRVEVVSRAEALPLAADLPVVEVFPEMAPLK